MLRQTRWDKGAVSSPLHRDRAGAAVALQRRRSRYPSECRKQLQLSCGLCGNFWPSPTSGFPRHPLAASGLAVPRQGRGVCAGGEEAPAGSPAARMAPHSR